MQPDCVNPVTSKLRKSEGFCPAPVLVTSMLTLSSLATRLAGTRMVTWVADTKVNVPRLVPAQVTVPPLLKPEPFKINVKAGLPTGTLEGDREVSEGRSFCMGLTGASALPLPPQPPSHALKL